MMDEKELTELQEAKRTAEAEVARLREALLLREARDVAAAELAKVELPEITRGRLLEGLAVKPVVVDGRLDVDAFKATIAEAAKNELAYLASVTGSGRVVGMGSAGGGELPLEEAEKRLAAAFGELGLSEGLAKRAAAGR